MRTALRRRPAAAFTLVEMLTVVGIIALLIALAAPALIDVVRSTRLNSAGDGLVNRISLAQQSAVALSSEVELRFYRYVDSTADKPGDNSFYAYQVVQSLPDGVQKALSDPYYLDSGIIISSQEELSPLLKTQVPQIQNQTGQYLFTPPGNIEGGDVYYAALRFYPDGSMRVLSSTANADSDVNEMARAYTIPNYDQSFMIIVESRDSANSQAPDNYYCVQIDSYTGRTRVYRP